MFKKIAVFSGLLLGSASSFALDTTAAVTAVTGASTDVEAVAVAVIGVAAVMFGISKVRQLIKA